MGLVSALSSVGFDPQKAKHLGFNTDYNISAAGNNSQSTGFQLSANVNNFAVVTNGSADSAVLPAFKDCPLGWVYGKNSGAGTLKLFPSLGETLINIALNNKIDVPSGSCFLYFKDDGDYTAANLWIGGIFS